MAKAKGRSSRRLFGVIAALLAVAIICLGVLAYLLLTQHEGIGGVSGDVAATESAAAPRVAALAGNRSVTLSWSAVPGAAGYCISVAQDGEEQSKSVSGETLTCTLEGLRGKYACDISVQAVDSSGFALGDAATTSATPEGPSAPQWFMEISDDIVAACYETPTTEIGWCAKWVNNVFDVAGHSVTRLDAPEMYYEWCTGEGSTDESELVPGMVVAAPVTCFNAAGTSFGHVGIYVGDGKVMDSVGYVRTLTLEEWCEENSVYSDVGWGIANEEP